MRPLCGRALCVCTSEHQLWETLCCREVQLQVWHWCLHGIGAGMALVRAWHWCLHGINARMALVLARGIGACMALVLAHGFNLKLG